MEANDGFGGKYDREFNEVRREIRQLWRALLLIAMIFAAVGFMALLSGCGSSGSGGESIGYQANWCYFELGTYLAKGDGEERAKVLREEKANWPPEGYVREVFDYYAPEGLDLTELERGEFTKAEAMEYLVEGRRIGICYKVAGGDHCKAVRMPGDWVHDPAWLEVAIDVGKEG